MSSSNFPCNASRLSASYGSENFKNMCEKYKDIISTLPKLEPSYPGYECYQYQGFWYPIQFLQVILYMQENFRARPSDIFLCSAMKTGTTWLKALTFSIMTRHIFHDDDSTNNPLLNKVPHDCLPFLEVDFISNPKFVDAELPLLSTHVPYSHLPPSILESNCKIIYICREPKDTLISLWRFSQKVFDQDESVANILTLEHQVKWFCEGKSFYGPYWNHVLGYWEASHDVERHDKVLFLKYEDLLKDTLYYVKKLAEFMERPFSMEEETRGVPEEIIARCNFKSLSNLEVNKTGLHRPETQRVQNSIFFRKGEIGDWKNYLTKDMAKAIDDITMEKFQSSGLTFPSSI
ncbi:flavonol sulfotransferase-like [Capsicum galapagoense]